MYDVCLLVDLLPLEVEQLALLLFVTVQTVRLRSAMRDLSAISSSVSCFRSREATRAVVRAAVRHGTDHPASTSHALISPFKQCPPWCRPPSIQLARARLSNGVRPGADHPASTSTRSSPSQTGLGGCICEISPSNARSFSSYHMYKNFSSLAISNPPSLPKNLFEVLFPLARQAPASRRGRTPLRPPLQKGLAPLEPRRFFVRRRSFRSFPKRYLRVYIRGAQMSLISQKIHIASSIVYTLGGRLLLWRLRWKRVEHIMPL
jgi:hypothetical protein